MTRNLSKRLFYSIAIVLAWFGFVLEGSHALFTDAASLTGNTISTGSVDLLISNSQNASSTVFADTRPGFTYSLNPGDSGEFYFLLKNSGSNGVPMDVDVSSSVTPEDSMNTMVNVEFTPVDATGISVGAISTASLSGLTNPIRLSATIPAGGTQRFKMKATLSAVFPEQNHTASFDLLFSGRQHVG
jgi:hypothetical protein